MKERIKKLNEMQDQAVDAWLDNNGVGTLLLYTGAGKNFCSFKCLYKALEKGWISKGAKVKFLAETEVRKVTLDEEKDKFLKIFGKNIYEDFDISFHCYQSVNSDPCDVQILDEIHCMATPKYMKNVTEYGAKYRIGLTATIPEDGRVYREENDNLVANIYQSEKDTKAGNITEDISKGQLLSIICPIVYEKSMAEAVEEGLTSPFKTFIIDHVLDNKERNIQLWKKSKRLVTEHEYYTSKRTFALQPSTNSFVKKNILARDLPRFLWTLPSKIPLAKAILKSLPGKSIVFARQKNILYQITDNVAEKSNKEELIEKFNKNEIKTIASSQLLKQGITLHGLNNVVLVSYSSSWVDLIQSLGRSRYEQDKRTRLIIIHTQNTYETKWLDTMQIRRDEKGRLKGLIDLNICERWSSQKFIK